ncbi:hypothetical protein MMC21_008434 [Puttea exsequens]|nr:hypothetical protein [Puttea exsequens]
MSTSQREVIELAMNSTPRDVTTLKATDSNYSNDDDAPANAVEAIPDGGYGWTVVFACSVITFMINGWSGSWGVLQTAVFYEYPNQESTTSLSFVGSLSIALAQHVAGSNPDELRQHMQQFYSGQPCLTYTTSNTLPVQWFSSRLGTANGLVKLGGGLGATIMAIVVQALIDKVGIAWTFRIVGFVSLVSGFPAALLVRERVSFSNAPWTDLSLFRSMPFCCLFLAGAVGTFALFVPPFFLPLFAHSIGLSASTGAGIVACFNACTAIGRLGAGFACDKFGSTNMLLLTMVLNAVSMLAVWPVSDTVVPLVAFAAMNGIANGSFFVTMPTAIGRMIGPGQAAVGMGMAITGWTGGYLMGSPIAGILISATGAEKAHTVMPYRAAIFYSGGVAFASATFVLVARLRMDTKLIKKV